MHSHGASPGDELADTRDAERSEKPKDLQEANENIRKSQGDDDGDTSVPNRRGNRPVVDRDR